MKKFRMIPGITCPLYFQEWAALKEWMPDHIWKRNAANEWYSEGLTKRAQRKFDQQMEETVKFLDAAFADVD